MIKSNKLVYRTFWLGLLEQADIHCVMKNGKATWYYRLWYHDWDNSHKLFSSKIITKQEAKQILKEKYHK